MAGVDTKLNNVGGNQGRVEHLYSPTPIAAADGEEYHESEAEEQDCTGDYCRSFPHLQDQGGMGEGVNGQMSVSRGLPLIRRRTRIQVAAQFGPKGKGVFRRVGEHPVARVQVNDGARGQRLL